MKVSKEQQDKSWRRYRIRKILMPIIILLFTGLYFLGIELKEMYDDRIREKLRSEQIREIIKSPDSNSYFTLKNKKNLFNLKVINWSEDSIQFNVCEEFEDKRLTKKRIETYNSCLNPIKVVTIAKNDLKNAYCDRPYIHSCTMLKSLDSINLVKLFYAYRYNGIDLRIQMGWNKKETKEKIITLRNEGIPIKIKQIISSQNNYVEPINIQLPTKLVSNSKIRLKVPIKTKFLPNSYRNQYLPYNFQIVIETEEYGEEIYDVLFDNNNRSISLNNLKM